VSNPKYQEAVSAGRSTYGITMFIRNFKVLPNSNLLIPRGLRRPLINLAKEKNIPLNIIDKRTFKPIEKDIDSTAINYRPYQYAAILQLIAAGDEGVLVAPPGSGKTVIGLSLVPLLSQPTLWLTHTNRLAQQALERTKTFLPSLEGDDLGFIGGGKWKIGNILTVAMIQTMIRKREKLMDITNDFGLVILDEAHHCPAPTFANVVGYLNPYYIYGLTATPYRRDGLETLMFQAMGEVGYSISLQEVAAQGSIMAPKIIYRTIHSRKVLDNNISKIIKDLIVDSKRNNLMVGDILQEAHNGNTCIVVSGRKVHCETLNELISIGWEKTGIATGSYSRKYVDEQVARFYSGEITVLCTTFDLLGEGFDVPFLNRAFIATPFRSEARVEQLVGRVQRTAENKNDAIVYDYIDADIGVLQNQFYAGPRKSCRYNVYTRLGLEVEPG
jgi:superfamily II DNA or RNA helicase